MGGQDSDFKTAHPSTAALVIEIAVNSPGLDRELASLYAEAGVGEYWIILALEQTVEIYRRPVNGVYQEKTRSDADATIICSSVPFEIISLREVFA